MARLSPYFSYKHDDNGNAYLEVYLRGNALLRMAATNKGTAFNERERLELGLEGMLPPQVCGLKQQVARLYRGYCRQPDDISKYQYLRGMQERSEVRFYAMLQEHLQEMMPIVYTPTVGKAVQQYSDLYQAPRGITVSPANIDHIDQILADYPLYNVRMIVATDASAILGIGDQGHGGLAICIGKLALYTAGAGVSPFHTMPVNIDVGTDRTELLEDPDYLGVHQPRLRGDAYFELLDRFVDAVKRRWPKATIQWEDFAKDVAFKVLARYKDRISSFNDDIQGTGAVTLSGLIAACKLKGESLAKQRIVVVGAGAGGVGVAKSIQDGLVHEGLTREQARRQMFVMDAHGLVVDGVSSQEYQLPVSQFADTYAGWTIAGEVPSLMEVIDQAKPTILLGLTGVSGLFSEPIVKHMARNAERPIIFPLSNPTSNCEAIPQDLVAWTEGKAIIATGSPFDDVEYEGKRHPVGQGNNAFVFPGIGFAAILGRCHRISDAMIIESAFALAEYTERHYQSRELIFPPINDLREVSMTVAARVLAVALRDGSAGRSDLDPDDLAGLSEYVRSRVWEPQYLPYVLAENAL
ncbi:NAD-dependent malic enzyme [Thiosocius teredinicola]|uniref:NAD-dependent malic enzyme n=1 Tax=Thiosocius teredinicola TaxID=1973002 RepID=UPI000990E98A